MESTHVLIGNLQDHMERAYEESAHFAEETGMEKKQALHLRLLTEETLGLAARIIGISNTFFWIEGDASSYKIHLETAKHLDQEKRQELLSVSSSGVNAAYAGFMGKVLSLFASPEELYRPWKLADYKAAAKQKPVETDAEERLADILSHSIVANIADDVEVSLSGNHIRMTIAKKYH